MNLKVIIVGKNHEKWVDSCITDYANRINKYNSFQLKYLKEGKGSGNLASQLKIERQLIFESIEKDDYVVCLDEKGKEYSSTGFAMVVDGWKQTNKKTVCLIIGGAYGFHQDVKERSNEMLALSKMTFTHQLVRIFLVEQLYRAFTIINKFPYHH
jgi:23S rRNA (pseudouridine1915-N3)-methyltransferase